MSLATLSPADDATLHWRQPDLMKFAFELASSPTRVFASLHSMKWTGTLMEAQSATGHWTFKQVGAWTPRIAIRNAGEDAELGALTISNIWLSNKADLRLGTDVVARWEEPSLWRRDVLWVTADGSPLITYRAGVDASSFADWFKTQCRVDLTPAGMAHPHRDLLLCVGWYLVVLQSQAGAA